MERLHFMAQSQHLGRQKQMVHMQKVTELEFVLLCEVLIAFFNESEPRVEGKKMRFIFLQKHTNF